MPDKRQTSKQRRAARNRAYREAMNARRENAGALRTSGEADSSSASSGSGSSGSGASRAAGGVRGGRRSGGLAGGLLGRGPVGSPGDSAVMLAVAFAIGAAALSIYAALDDGAVPVDHEGEALGTFAAVNRQTHALLSGQAPATETTSYIDAAGPVILVFILLPLLVAVGTFLSHRRRVQSRPLTFGLVGMALVSLVNPFSLYFLPSLIALAVAGFQVRKAEMPERMAAAGRDEDADDEDDEVIDVDEVEPEDELDEDEYDDDEYDEEDEDVDGEYDDEYDEDEDEVAEDEGDEVEDESDVRAEGDDAAPEGDPPSDATPGGKDDAVLAELEAEIEAEEKPDTRGGRRRR